MAILIKYCAGSVPCCNPLKLFRGFLNDGSCPNYYKYLAIFDWDKCLLSCSEAATDSFSSGGLSLSSPLWGDADSSTFPGGPCCSNSSDDPACCCSDCSSDPPCTPLYKTNLVDGHRVYENNEDGTCTCIEATNNHSSHLGEVINSCDIYQEVSTYGGCEVSEDQYFYWAKDGTGCAGCTYSPPSDVIRGYLWNE